MPRKDPEEYQPNSQQQSNDDRDDGYPDDER
jgi:hypothetical protein